MDNFKHEYLRSPASTCLSLSSFPSSPVTVIQLWILSRYSCLHLGSRIQEFLWWDIFIHHSLYEYPWLELPKYLKTALFDFLTKFGILSINNVIYSVTDSAKATTVKRHLSNAFSLFWHDTYCCSKTGSSYLDHMKGNINNSFSLIK